MDTEGFTFDLVTQRFIKNRWETDLGQRVLREVIDGIKNGVEIRAILDSYVLEHPENQDPYGHPYYPKSEMKDGAFWGLTQDDLRGIHVYNETFPANSSWTVKSLNYARFYNCDLKGTNLERTELSMATFEKCNMEGVVFAGSGGYGTRLIDSNLKGACLWNFGLINGDLSGTDIRDVYLESARIENIKVNYLTKFDGRLAEKWETRSLVSHEIPEYLKAFRVAYEHANIWHKVDQFLNLERSANRKHILYPAFKADKSAKNAREWFFDLIWGVATGYGTKPSRLLLLSVVVALFYALIYYFVGNPSEDDSFVTSVYFSFTTFSTLGYGDLSYSNSQDVMRLISTSEALVGASLIAAFVGVLSRKVIRH
ncbi:TPA: pentapeptide repeat-containing protein [Vibrio parahaemolyticus]|nr:pentapeptide repeat-containing protein [Vibrio parahaemolyticus]